MKRHVVASVGLVGIAALVAVGSASAADVLKPVYKAPPPAQVLNWTGVYVGGHIGWGGVKEDYTLQTFGPGASSIPIGSVNGIDRDAFLGGAQIGYNWQTGHWVLGVEGDWSWTKNDGQTAVAGTGGTTTTTSADTNWYATATGRVGYAWDSWLVYAKGGAAWMNADYSSSTTITGVGSGNSNNNSSTRSGWTVGAGVEQAFAGNWSWKLEYDYMDFGTKNYNFTTTVAGVTNTATNAFDTQVHVVKLGINYRFNGLMFAGR